MEQATHHCPHCGIQLTLFGKFWMCPEHGPQDMTTSYQEANTTAKSAAHTPNTKHDLFISYAHVDNENGWIDHFVASLKKEYIAISGQDLKVFFDKDTIKNGDDWQHRIAANVASSTQFVIFMSPNYFKSEWCRREWRKWIDTEIANHLLNQGVSPIQIVPIQGLFDGSMTTKDIAHLLTSQANTPNRIQLERAISRHIHEIQLRHHDSDKYMLDDDYTHILHAAESDMLQHKLQELATQVHTRNQLMNDATQSDSTVWAYNRNFTGRLDELMQLNRMLTDNIAGVVTCIRGLGGMGKTELANTYAHAYAHQYLGGRFRIACEGHTSLIEALVNQASEHQGRYIFEGIDSSVLTDIRASFALICNNIQQRLTTKGSILLILDNVSEAGLMDTDDLDELTALGSNLHILATSRESVLDNPDNELLLGPLQPHDSLELLRKFRYFEDGSEEADAALQICQKLGGFTLAIELLGAYIAARPGISYAYQLEHSDLSNLEDIATSKKGKLHRHNSERQLSAIMQPLYASLTDNKALLLVAEYAALLPPDTIPVSWIKTLLQENYPVLQKQNNGFDFWLDLYDVLQQSSILTADGEYTSYVKTVRMHRLLQDWIKAQMSEEDRLEKQAALSKILFQRVIALLDNTDWKEDQWEYAVIMDTIPLILDAHTLPPEQIGQLFNLSHQLEIYGQLQYALQLLKYIREVMLVHYFNQPADIELGNVICTSYNNIAHLHARMGHIKQALDNYRNSMQLSEALINLDSTNLDIIQTVATTYNNSGSLFQDIGLTEEALDCFKRVLDIRNFLIELYPEDSSLQRDLASSYSHLASLHSSQKRHQEALELYQKSAKIRESQIKLEPISVTDIQSLASAYNDLASQYYDMADNQKAVAYYKQALEIREKLAESYSDHESIQQDLSSSYHHFGYICAAMDLPKEALFCYTKALQIRKTLVKNNPDDIALKQALATTSSNIGCIYTDMANHEDAIPYHQQALTLREGLVQNQKGSNKVINDLIETYKFLEYLYEHKGQNQQALDYSQKRQQLEEKLA